jgi:hypothetical protein
VRVERAKYHDIVEKKHGKPMEALDVERSILRGWKREWDSTNDYWHEDSYEFPDLEEPMKVSGWAQHGLRYMQLAMPDVEMNSWMVYMWKELAVGIFTHKRKIINFIGSKNSGKTNFVAMFINLMVSIDEEFTRAFVSGPYKTAADATVWGRVGTRLRGMKKMHPERWGKVEEVPSAMRVIYSKRSTEAGYIELVTLDKVGKLQGAKSLDQDRGWLILICDEIGTFPTHALKDLLDNMTGNRNFLCITGCNFRNTEGLEGDLCRPEGREYAELNAEVDFTWLSGWKSYTIRLDGHRSPNVVCKRLVSKHLLTEDTRADMQDIHGLNGPKYLEQIRSFPNMSMSDNYVTTREKIVSAGGFDDFVWVDNDFTLCGFCDPGFGGDPCKVGVFRFGRARVPTLDGEWRDVSIFEPVEPLRALKIDTKLIADEQWVRRLKNISKDGTIISPGKLVTVEQQISVQCAEYMRFHGVDHSHFGFDGSMRSGIVKEFLTVMGNSVQPIDFGGMATERIVSKDEKTARDLYYNFVTELHFNFGDCVQSGQFRGADKVPASIAQLCRRPFKFTGARKQIQTKVEYKEANQGRSPDDSDTLIGGYEMALRLGFNQLQTRNADENDMSDFIEKLRSLPSFARFTTKPLRKDVL